MNQCYDEDTNLVISYYIYEGEVNVDLGRTYYKDTGNIPKPQDFGLKSDYSLTNYLGDIADIHHAAWQEDYFDEICEGQYNIGDWQLRVED